MTPEEERAALIFHMKRKLRRLRSLRLRHPRNLHILQRIVWTNVHLHMLGVSVEGLVL